MGRFLSLDHERERVRAQLGEPCSRLEGLSAQVGTEKVSPLQGLVGWRRANQGGRPSLWMVAPLGLIFGRGREGWRLGLKGRCRKLLAWVAAFDVFVFLMWRTLDVARDGVRLGSVVKLAGCGGFEIGIYTGTIIPLPVAPLDSFGEFSREGARAPRSVFPKSVWGVERISRRTVLGCSPPSTWGLLR
jgi:hypothetical protein